MLAAMQGEQNVICCSSRGAAVPLHSTITRPFQIMTGLGPCRPEQQRPWARDTWPGVLDRTKRGSGMGVAGAVSACRGRSASTAATTAPAQGQAVGALMGVVAGASPASLACFLPPQGRGR